MDTRWQKIEEAVSLAADVPASQRQAWLEEFCAGDDGLHSEIESLLKHETNVANFLEQPIAPYAANLLNQDQEKSAGQIIGPYRIIREIGRGGMGMVYLATREDEQFHQQVAIKLVKRGLDTEDILRRFRNERQILASLNHPNISSLHDGGTSQDGRPYFVMEHVQGLPLLQYSVEKILSIRQRLQLFQKICGAVQYAHQNLIIHRDLKPSNILVTNEGEVKLLDFGVAKLLDPELTGSGFTHTRAALRVMTPEYASPEQIRGQHVTTATDVYSLGVILYELLTGAKPYKLKDTSPEELSHAICDVAPSKPSTVGRGGGSDDSHTSNPQFEIRNSNFLRGDIDNIVLMALRKEPERRYKSVDQFSADIERHLKGLPVIASKDTFNYRASKFISRHRVGVAAAAMIGVALVGGIIATAWQARVARRERDRARIEQVKTLRVNTFLQDILKASDPGRQLPNSRKGHELTIKDALDYAAARVSSEMADQPDARAELQNIIGNSYLTLGQYDLAEQHLRASLSTQIDLRGEDNPEAIKTLVALGQLLTVKGDNDAAEPIYRRLIAIYRRSQATNHANAEDFAVVLNDFSLLLRQQGRFAEAESLLHEALALAPGIPDEMRGVVGLVRTNLALVLADQGDFARAEALYRVGIAESRQTPGRERVELAVGLTGLGDVLVGEGKYAEAQSVLEEGEGIYRSVLGNAHPYLATNLGIQGDVLYFKDDYAGAERKINSCLEILRSSVSEKHPRYASALTALGLVINKSGRSSQAEAPLREALQIRKRLFPAGHYMIASTEGALGEFLTTQERFAEAEGLLISSYESLNKSQRPKSPRIERALRRLITLYESSGRADQAANYRSKL